MNGRPPVQPLRSAAPIAEQPFKHVIETYIHRDQTITCVCGWHGSCAPGDRGASPWTSHLQEFRTKKR